LFSRPSVTSAAPWYSGADLGRDIDCAGGSRRQPGHLRGFRHVGTLLLIGATAGATRLKTDRQSVACDVNLDFSKTWCIIKVSAGHGANGRGTGLASERNLPRV